MTEQEMNRLIIQFFTRKLVVKMKRGVTKCLMQE
jgi:hypothetical protein